MPDVKFLCHLVSLKDAGGEMEGMMNSLRVKLIFAIVAAVLFLSASRSFAETEEADKWKLTLGPNLWLAGIEGNVNLRGQEKDIDISFSDLIKDVQGGFMFRIEARKEKYGFFLQPNYLKLSKQDQLANVDAEINVDFWLIELGGFYQLAKFKKQSALDLLVGVRQWSLSTDIDVSVPKLGVAESRSFDGDLTDPFVGLRFVTFLTDRLSFEAWGDVGGFDISDNTPKRSWQAGGKFGYKIFKRANIFAGYRAIGIEVEKNNNRVDLTFLGPIVGFTTQW